MENPNHSAIITNFMAILHSIDYNKFERFSNAADEISAKLLSSFLVVPDRNDFQFWIKDAERKRKLKLLITKKFQSHFKFTLGIRAEKPASWNLFSKNG